jgi:uncharacterized protein
VPIIASAFLLAAIALGHVAIVTWFINVSHGFGFSEAWFRRLEALTLAFIVVVSSILAYFAVQLPWISWPPVLHAYGWICLAAALLVLPGVTLVRNRRREPPEVSRAPRSREPIQPSEGSSWVGDGRTSWWLRIPGNQALQVWTSECDVRFPGLPAELDGLRILHLSDFHFSPAFQRGYFDAVIDVASAIESDLILFTGDLVDSKDSIEWIRPLFSRLRGRLGQYAILGNHDLRYDHRQIYRAYLDSGFEIVEGRWITRQIDGATLAIGGTSYPWGRRLDLSRRPSTDLSILLSHSPDLFYKASRHAIDLMLSGHNHGGQVRIPGIGPILMPSRHGRRLDRGFFRRKKTLLHVSPGVGAKHPLRINCPPEFTRIVLRANSKSIADEGLSVVERGAARIGDAGT